LILFQNNFQILRFQYIPVVDESEIPAMKKTTTLPAVVLSPINTILSEDGRKILGSRAITSNSLLTFEELNQFSGFVLYETYLPSKFTRDPAILEVMDLRDRAFVYVDGELIGTLSRENYISKLPLCAGFEGSKLSILVENQGRINFQIADDYKGIRNGVRVQTFHDTSNTFVTVSNWTITGFPFERIEQLENFARSNQHYHVDASGNAIDGPIVFHAEFNIMSTDELYDTYWDTSDWGKGFIFVNGFNLGRYWPIGPQITMYIPKEILKRGKNEIYVVELQKAPTSFRMSFVNAPIFINDEKV
jgi:beta-galactosidase